jgi:hypothetical protein
MPDQLAGRQTPPSLAIILNYAGRQTPSSAAIIRNLCWEADALVCLHCSQLFKIPEDYPWSAYFLSFV